MKDTTFTVQNVSDIVEILGNVWWKAKMFDAELKNAGHVFGTKIVTFIINQRSKMDATLKAMKALIVSCMELFPAMIEPSEEWETSSSYSDLTPHDMVEIQGVAIGGGNQHVEDVDQVEDITALTVLPVSATEVVDPITTLVSSTVGEETLDGCLVADVTPPSLAMAFHVVAGDSPPLALFTLEFPPDNRLSAPLAPNVTESVDHVGVIIGPDGYEVSVPPPLAPSLAINSADRREKRKQNKMEAKLENQKDRN